MHEASGFYSNVYRRDEGYGRMMPYREKVLRQWIQTYPKARSLLDVGCGRGMGIEIAREEGIQRARGCDIVPQLVSDDIDLLADGVEFMPYLDDSYDLVSALDVLEHLKPENIQSAISEMLRVSRVAILAAVPHEQDKLGSHFTLKPREWWLKQAQEVSPDAHILDTPMWLPKAKLARQFQYTRIVIEKRHASRR